MKDLLIMSEALDSLFNSVSDCKEKDFPCKSVKKDVENIYKPDDGIKDIELKKKLFPNYGELEQPKLCDCIIEFNNGIHIQVEIKCGKVTNSLAKDVVIKLKNSLTVVNAKGINVSKNILIFKKFHEQQTRKFFTLSKNFIQGKPIILKEYKNKAIEI